MKSSEIKDILEVWRNTWPAAKQVWSNYVRLREPEWCIASREAEKEGLRESFAMIRLNDHRIVIDIEQVQKLGIEDCALQVIAHEIGHHIYTPANLKDNAVVMAKIRWSLADMEDMAPMVANLYEDLLINDRLQRLKELDMALVYKKLNRTISFSKLWTLYMRAYEYLWRLEKFTLISDRTYHSESIDADASVMASLIKSYAKKWIEGASRFGALLYPYLMEEKEKQEAQKSVIYILDADEAGKGGGVVAGMTEFDGEVIVDPRSEVIGGDGEDESYTEALTNGILATRSGGEGPRQRYLNPGTYVDLLRQVNPDIDRQELLIRYYKEVALPHLIDFPVETTIMQDMTLPEGMEVWDIGDSADEIDWIETTIYSPHIIPGVNTLKRTFGPSDDENLKKAPLDVYIGIDCSGSMGNPAVRFSWPVMAASIVALSALRAGARVFGCLSGEPGSFMQNDDYESDEKKVMSILTSYLGTGYAYGVGRLKEPFQQKLKRKSHLIIVTDDDIFSMLDAKTDNGDDHWEIIEYALANAGGIGTIVLHSRPNWHREEVVKLQNMGWHIHYVTNEEELLTFAKEFSNQNY